MQLRANNISFAHSESTFNDVSFSVADGEKIGLVGDNGSGKSTLLRCLARLEEVHDGSISYPKSFRIGYVEQSIPSDLENKTLHEVIEVAIPKGERSWAGYKVELLLESFGAPDNLSSKKISELSGGWRRIALIGRAMMDEPDLLLLDEPTNHLDMQKILKLEAWLKSSVRIPYVIISHDRTFLDNCTSRTLFLRDTKLFDFPASYTTARQLLAEQDKTALKKREDEEQEADRLSKSAHTLRMKGIDNYSDSLKLKAKQVQNRADAVKANFTEVYIPPERKIQLGNRDTHAKSLITYKDADVQAPNDSLLFEIKELEIKKGERIVIFGENGSGKSCFLKKLVDDYHLSQSGTRKEDSYFTPSIRLSYVDQELSSLPVNETIISYIQHTFNLDDNRTISQLVQVGFPYRVQNKKIGDLSFGERARLAFLAVNLENPNLYILDEPTNHLDLDGQDRLENEILTNGATCVIVTHDRRMVQNLATSYCQITDGTLKEVDSPKGFYEHLLKSEDDSI